MIGGHQGRSAKPGLELPALGQSFAGGDFHVFVRFVHGASGVFLRAAAGPADHFRDQVFESWRGHTMVRFINPGIHVQSRVNHDAVNEVVDDGGDGVDAAEALVKCGGAVA
jgi:hypothetical protein